MLNFDFNARVKIGFITILILVSGLLLTLPAGGLPSKANSNGVYLELVTTGSDNWTASAGTELFNITVNNTNSSLSLNEVNISVPLSGSNATFVVDVGTIDKSVSSWNCTNATSDAQGNTTLIRCNTSAADALQSGSVLYVWFNADAPSTTSEDVHNWNVTVLNATAGFSVSQNITSGVDGLAPRFSSFDENQTNYFDGSIFLWVTVTDPNLDNTTVNIEIVNASEVTQQIANPTNENCTQISADAWNCTVTWSTSSDGNYTFNVSASDELSNSNESTYSGWFLYDSTDPVITYISNYTQAGNYSQDWLIINVSVSDLSLNFTGHNLSSEGIFNNSWDGNNGNYYWVTKSGMPDGYYSYYVFANDSLGNNQTSSPTITVLLDTQAPSVAIHEPQNITYNYTSNIPLNFSINDTYGVHLCWYAINATNTTTNISLTDCANTTLSLNDGKYNITIYANDTSGNINSAIEYFTVDTTSPSITLISPDREWDEDGDGINFQYRPYDELSSILNCSLWMTDDNATNWTLITYNTSAVNNNQTNTITQNGLTNSTNENGTYYWNVQCWDGPKHSAFGAANNTLFVGDRPNLMIREIVWSQNPAPYVGQIDLEVNVTVGNNGTADVNNMTNLTFCFHSSNEANPCASSGRILRSDSETVQASVVQEGENHTVTYYVNVTGGGGFYYFKAIIDNYDNETMEQYDGSPPATGISDNSLIDSFSTNLNVTIVNITKANQYPAYPKAEENVTVTVKVLYDNGTAVTGVELDNITLYDKWVNYSIFGTQGYRTIDNSMLGGFDDTQQSSGIYTFNYTVPGMNNKTTTTYYSRYGEFDLHYIYVKARDNGTGYLKEGTSPTDVSLYHILAPFLSVSASSFEMEDDETKLRSFTVYNYGTDNITENVNLSASRNPTSGLAVDITDPEYLIPALLNDDSQELKQIQYIASSENTYTVKINASTRFDQKLYYYTKEIEVDVSNATDGNGDEDGDGQQPPIPCITNSSCASNKWCDNGACVALNCQTGYYASNHMCKESANYDIDIRGDIIKKNIYIIQGNYATKNVTVKNTGNRDLSVMLEASVTGAGGVNFSVEPASQSIESGEKKNFTVNITVAKTVAVGNYTGTYKVTTSSTAGDTEEFTLVVMPLPETRTALDASYLNFSSIMDALLAEFLNIKTAGSLSEENLTALEGKINSTKDLWDSAKDAKEKGDYVALATYLNQLNAAINETRTLMKELGVATDTSAFWNNVIMWLVIGIVIIGAAGLLLYMMIPPQGYTLGKGYAPGGKATITDKIKGALLSIKNKITGGGRQQPVASIVKKGRPAYVGGYAKLGRAYAPESGGIFSKIKKIFKRG